MPLILEITSRCETTAKELFFPKRKTKNKKWNHKLLHFQMLIRCIHFYVVTKCDIKYFSIDLMSLIIPSENAEES